MTSSSQTESKAMGELKQISNVAQDFVIDPAPRNTVCEECGKPLDPTTAIYFVNGLGFCSSQCETKFKNKCEFGVQIQDTIQKFIPPIYQMFHVEQCPTPDKALEVMKWEYNPQGMFVWGNAGSGKSRSVFILIKRLIEERLMGVQDKSLQVYTSGALRVDFDASFNNKKSNAFFDKIKNVSLLVIDDFGKEKFTESYESFIFNIFEYRISYMLPTILTSNYVGDDLRAKFFEEKTFDAFARRIKEFFKFVHFTGNKNPNLNPIE